MTQEEKSILLQDLCARLPYGVKVLDDMGRTYELPIGNTYLIDLFYGNGDYIEVPIKPYLRPMSSMTEEEYNELKSISSYYGFAPYKYIGDWCPNYEMIDWLIKHHFDYRGLIPMGLALEAPEGMYK